MNSLRCLVFVVTLLQVLSPYQFNAQPEIAATGNGSSLDALLQDNAYRAFDRPRTGVTYTADVPSNFSGILLSVVRLRSGSLRSRGVRDFYEFDIPTGIIATPYVVRLALVYQNLGNWSSVYYVIPGYTLVTPVIGLLVYEAANLSATNLPELDVVASAEPISINFRNLIPFPSKQAAKCVHFHLNGSYQIGDLASGDICTAYGQGHFSVVVNSTTSAPSPAPSLAPSGPSLEHAKKGKSNVWKIVVGVVGGFLALVLLVLLMLWLLKYRRSRKMTDMVKRSETGEVLTTQRIGNAQIPVATMVRTRPVLENEYAP